MTVVGASDASRDLVASGPRMQAAQRLLPVAGRRPVLDRLADLAARLLSASSAQVSLLTDQQTVAAGAGGAHGTVGTVGPLQDSLCSLVAASREALLVADAVSDERVSALPPVTAGEVGAYLGVPLISDDGSAVGAFCVYGGEARTWSPQDVALLEQLAAAVMAELELAALSSAYESERLRWELAVDAAGIGSFDWDLASGRLDWDDRMKALFGYAMDEFQPNIETGFSRISGDDRPQVDAAIEAAVDSCGDYRAEFRVLLPDGSVRWLHARGRAVPGADGAASRLVGTAHDVTEVRTARDEAARVLETMGTGFVAVDRDWRVTYLNAEGARVIGVDPESLVGRELWEAFPGLAETEFGDRYRRVVATREIDEIEAFYPHLNSWFLVRAIPAKDGLGLYFLDVTGRHADQAAARAATERLRLLASVSAELAAAGLDPEGAVARLAQTVVPVLADWCVVSLTVDGGGLRDVGTWHADPELQPVVELYVQERLKGRTDFGVVQQARETGEPVVVTSGVTERVLPTLGSDIARETLIQLAPQSVVVVPLTARGHMTAVLTLLRGADRPPMSEDEIDTCREIASRAGLALDNARLYADQRSLAEVLQRSLLTTPPEPDHCEISVRYVPAAEEASVGGDWFDSFLQSDGATVLVIGDVMGHDTAAAAAMGQVRGLLRGIAWHTGAPPAEVLSGLDAAMQGLQLGTTATAVVARLEQDLDERARGITRLRWSNAGHPPPMAIHPDGSVMPLVATEADLLLGIDPHSPRAESVLVLDRGSTVLLYTDGLVERRGQDLDEGLALLRTTLGKLSHLPLEELCDRLLEELLPDDADDDVALVAVRLHRQDEPRPAEAGPRDVPPDVPPEPVLPGQNG